MEYKVIRSRRKTAAISITESKEVVVRAPLSLSEKKIGELVRSHKPWLEAKLREAGEREARERAFRDSGLFILQGREYAMVPVDGTEILVGDDEIRIGRDADLDHFYRSRLEPLAEKLRLKWLGAGRPSAIAFRRQKTLWGSCAADGTIRLNLLLAKAPLRVAEYVYLHELVHLEIRDHSRAFWNRVEELMPDYREARRWLKLNGRYLFL